MFQRNLIPALVLIFCLLSVNALFSQTTEETNAKPKEKFKAGPTILHHVGDAHSWHITGNITVPLPMIVKTDKGVEFFSSSVFMNEETHEPTNVYTSPSSGYDFMLHHEQLKIAKRENGELVKKGEEFEEDEEATSKAGILDMSITKNVFSLLFVALIMCWIFLSTAKKYKKNPNGGTKGIQSLIEPLIVFVRDDVAKPSIGKKYEKFMPFLLTVFFFIWISNLLGLIPFMPGGANLTGSVSITMVLALITFIITLVNTNGHYWRHIFAMPGVPIPVLIILTPIEILGIFIKPFVLMVRLFANITAGHIIALAFFSLIFIFGEKSTGAGLGVSVVSVIFTIFMFFMELLVAFLQAYVFTLLSAMYFGGAVDEGHHAHEEHHPETAAAH